MNDKGFFYADYSVGKVTVASKTVDAGQYTVELLNQYYKDDTAARISIFRAENWELEDTLSKGYLNPRLFVEAVTVINNIFTALPKRRMKNTSCGFFIIMKTHSTQRLWVGYRTMQCPVIFRI